MEAVSTISQSYSGSEYQPGTDELKKGFSSWRVEISVAMPEIGFRQISISDADVIAVGELILAWNTHVSRLRSLGKGKDLHRWEVAKELNSLWIADEAAMTAGEIAVADELLGKFLKRLQRGYSLRNL